MATKRWLGGAADVRQLDLFTFGGTWAGGETTALVCNLQRLEVTSDASDFTTSDMAAYYAAAINAGSRTQRLINAESRNYGGREIPEFLDVRAYSVGAILYVESVTPGQPFTITADDSGSTSGTITRTTGGSGASVAPTGKNWITNADNFEGGVALTDGDECVADVDAPDILYGFDSFTAVNVTFTRRPGYRSNVGLLPINPRGYLEYRTPDLPLEVDGSASPSHMIESEFGRTYLNLGTLAPDVYHTVNVLRSRLANSEGAAVRIVGGVNVRFYQTYGSSAIGTVQGANATGIDYFIAGRKGDQRSLVEIGPGVTFNSDHLTTITGGLVTSLTDITNNTTQAIDLQGGVLQLRQKAPLTLANLGATDISGGGMLACIGSVAAQAVEVFSGGRISFEEGRGGCSFSSLTVHRGAHYIDPAGVYIGAVRWKGCNPADMGDGKAVLRNDIVTTLAKI